MKKTKLMRAALLLLVLTLITSCFVGGTFAKYVTKGDSTDTARVAKWGVTVTANGSTFAKNYDTDNADVARTIAKSVVSSESNKNVVAPGTKGDMVKMTITGTPEVAVRVNYAANFKVENWIVDGKFYCPLHIKVGSTWYDGTGYDSKDAFETAVSKAISDFSGNYDAGTNLSSAKVTVPSVSWEWPYENTGASTDTGVKNAQTNEKDTALGDMANAPSISLTVTTTVTQID